MRSAGSLKDHVSEIQIKTLHFVIITVIIGSSIHPRVNKPGLGVMYLYIIRVKGNKNCLSNSINARASKNGSERYFYQALV